MYETGKRCLLPAVNKATSFLHSFVPIHSVTEPPRKHGLPSVHLLYYLTGWFSHKQKMMLLRYSLVDAINHGPGATDDVAKVLKAAHGKKRFWCIASPECELINWWNVGRRRGRVPPLTNANAGTLTKGLISHVCHWTLHTKGGSVVENCKHARSQFLKVHSWVSKCNSGLRGPNKIKQQQQQQQNALENVEKQKGNKSFWINWFKI